jgi:hypothetical protein
MKKIFALALCVLSLKVTASAQDSILLKRPVYKLRVSIDRHSSYEANIESTPYLLPTNILQVYPGEHVYLEVGQTDGIIHSLRATSEIQDSSKTLIILFSQVTASDVHTSMVLKIVNPFPYDLMYAAKMLTLQKKWVLTDVLPVHAKIIGIETWQNVIISLALFDWKFVRN